MGYYILKYLSVTFTVQEKMSTDGQVSKACELAAIYEYLCSTKAKTNWYRE